MGFVKFFRYHPLQALDTKGFECVSFFFKMLRKSFLKADIIIVSNKKGAEIYEKKFQMF